MKEIKKIINIYRIKESNFILIRSIIHFLIAFLFIFLFTSIIEYIFYLDLSVRTAIFHLSTASTIIFFSYVSLKWIIHNKSFFNYKNDFDIAKDISHQNKSIKDKLTNVLQINNTEDYSNQDLKLYAVKQLKKQLDEKFLPKINFRFPKTIVYTLIFIFGLLMLNTLSYDFRFAIKRLVKYSTPYAPPTPFNITSLSGSFSILSGDTLNIEIAAFGEAPDSLDFYWVYDEIKNKKTIPNNNEIYRIKLNDIDKDLEYWAEYQNPTFFSSWNFIKTNSNIIKVKSRPQIEQVTFSITPPAYTNINPYIHDKSNINQLEIIKGSMVSIDAFVDKKLQSAWILINNKDRISLQIKNDNIFQTLNLNEDLTIKIYCLDQELISNLNPMQYSFISKEDNSPNIVIRSPELQFELDEQLLIPIKLNIYDDYGINEIWIEYQVTSQDFPELKKNIKKIFLDKIETTKKIADINYDWDISSEGILMGDELHFWVAANDYDNINGPNIGRSQELVGIFPSLEDLFYKVEEYEYDTKNIVDDMQESIEEISDIAEEIRMELLKNDDLSWEQEKKLEQTFDEVNETFEQIEEIQKNLDQIIEQASKNNLFDNELLEKFDYFKEMLQNIMSEELLNAMEQLQEAFNNLDKNKMLEALQNYEFNVQKLEEELDRFIDMFELAMAEQKLNELNKEIENMINKQTDLIKDIEKHEDSYVLEKKSTKQENRFESFQEQLDEAENLLKDISSETSENINQLSESNLTSNTEEKLSKQTQEIKSQENEKPGNNSKEAKNDLEEIANILDEINNQFKNENINKMTKEFIIIIDNLLTMSNQQEEIIAASKGLRSNNPELRKINQNQNNIDRELNQITKQLIDLSNKTFFINPKINRIIGKLKNSISKTISSFEQKKMSDAKKSQINILKNINEVTFLLLLSMEEMQNSDSVSGFEQFMKSLEEMSQKQEGINNQTMQLGQMGMMMQQSMMQQLMQQQQDLKNKLSEMLGDMPGENSGGLPQANEGMEEIIQDFKNKNITQKTIDRQKNILSRMLDSQKSLTKKDYSEKRQGKMSNEKIFSGPGNLPKNMGEKDLLLINAMEAAVDEGHSLEYQKLIRLYFLNLQKEGTNVK